MTSHDYVVILAGGSGTRLWPMSRKSAPKHFEPYVKGDLSTYQQMYNLTRAAFPAEQIIVMTVPEYVDVVKSQTPDILPYNILCDPEKRDYGPAYGLLVNILLRRDPAARVAVVYADAYVRNAEPYAQMLRDGFQAVSDYPDNVTAAGIRPTSPHTAYGYIQLGECVKTYEPNKLYKVKRFTEKPDRETAQTYLDSGDYLWNLGFKFFRAEYFWSLFEGLDSYIPETITKVADLIEADGALADMKALYSQLPKLSVEYLLTEKMTGLMVLETEDLGWTALSTWDSLETIVREAESDPKNHIAIDTHNTFIYGKDRLIVTQGLEDMLVIDCGDVVFVGKKDKLNGMKDVLEALKDRGERKLL